MSVVSNTYPSLNNESTGPLFKRGSAVSVQVKRTTGAGAVGTYQLQSSNDGETFINEGSAITTESITEFTTVNKQVVKVINTVPPAGGTEVEVTLYADAPGE